MECDHDYDQIETTTDGQHLYNLPYVNGEIARFPVKCSTCGKVADATYQFMSYEAQE